MAMKALDHVSLRLQIGIVLSSFTGCCSKPIPLALAKKRLSML